MSVYFSFMVAWVEHHLRVDNGTADRLAHARARMYSAPNYEVRLHDAALFNAERIVAGLGRRSR